MIWETPLRTGNLRDPNGPQVTFAFEGFIDELAAAARKDPAQFRLDLIEASTEDNVFRKARSLAVVRAALDKYGWDARPSPKPRAAGTIVTGRGIAYTYRSNTVVAVIADVEVNRDTGGVWVKRFVCAHDCGLAINPMGLSHTVECGMLHGLSRALWEEVQFDAEKVTSVDWASHPSLRHSDTPETIDIVLVNGDPNPDRPDLPHYGAGETSHKPVIAAVANAITTPPAFDCAARRSARSGCWRRSAPRNPSRQHGSSARDARMTADTSLPDCVRVARRGRAAAARDADARAWVRGLPLDAFAQSEDTRLPRALEGALPALTARFAAIVAVRSEHRGADHSTRLLLTLGDGRTIESVLLPGDGVCVSTQVGCAVGCVFCMTGRDGLARHLTSGEIVAQVALARTRQRVRRVVFMGMGEPAHNLDNVLDAIALLGEQGDLATKNLVFSTVGDRRVFERLPLGRSSRRSRCRCTRRSRSYASACCRARRASSRPSSSHSPMRTRARPNTRRSINGRCSKASTTATTSSRRSRPGCKATTPS